MNNLSPIKKLETLRTNVETNNSLVPAEAVHEFIELKTALEAQIKATWRALEDYMISNDIKHLDALTIAEKKSWEIKGTLPPRFYKQVVNTTKLNSMVKLGEKLPKGVTYTSGSYITKTNRRIAK